jgi:hypothetical protein
MTKILVKRTSEIAFNERNNSGEVMVEIKGKTYKALINQHYQGNGVYSYTVRIEGLEVRQLESLGVVLDTEEIIEAHKVMVKKVNEEKKAKEEAERKSSYEKWKKIASQSKMSIRPYESFRDGPGYNILSRTENYKGKDVEVSTDYRDGWYSLSIGYNREDKRRTKKVEKLDGLATELMDIAKKRVDCAIEGEKRKVSGLEKVKEAFGKDVEPETAGHSDGRGRWQSYPCYQVKVGDDYDSPRVRFVESYKGYKVLDIRGTFSNEEMEVILDVVRNCKHSKAKS